MDSTKLVATLIGAVIGGTLCGLIPYFFGRKRGQPTLGIAGLVCCIVGGLIAGLILALHPSWRRRLAGHRAAHSEVEFYFFLRAPSCPSW